MSSHRRRLVAFAAALLCAIPLASECVYWLAARLSDPGERSGSCAVLVLGYPTRADGSADPIQRLRVTAAVEAFQRRRCQRLVVSGGAAHNERIEADAMAELARELGVASESIVAERAARNTWENVALSLPSLEGFDSLYVVSDSLHALRGRRYVCEQRPELCARTFAAGAYHPFEGLWWKVPGSLWEGRAWLRDALTRR